MKRIIATPILALTVAFSAHCQEREIPKEILGKYRQKAPICFFTSIGSGNDCGGYAYDMIAIEPKTPKLVYTGITLIFQNAERCHFYGIGRWNGQLLTASAPSYTGRICRIKILFADHAARIVGTNGACNEGFCGYHGTLNFSEPLRKYHSAAKGSSSVK